MTMKSKNKHLMWRLLRKNISAAQIGGYALANLVGLAIVLCAVRFYSDVSTTFQSDDSFMRKDFLVISQKVSSLNAMGLSHPAAFTADDIADIARQPWVRSVGAFTAADFNVSMSVDMGGRAMSTHMFLESIPDSFLDIEPSDWSFDPSASTAPTVPIIMSKDYLSLYNFGFAASRGMPQLSETLMAYVPITLHIAGADGRSLALPARIVGFSNRLNTIAVPQDFMDWANKRYGHTAQASPSRLIVEVNTPGDPAIERYMDRHGYEIAGDKADNSRASYFLTLVTAVVIIIGAIISVLAFFILMLSIFLLLQKNRSKLHSLMLLGYSPGQVSRPYIRLVLIVNGAVLVLALVATIAAAAWWQPRLAEIGIQGGSPVPALATGIAIMAAVSIANVLTIRRLVKRNF